MSVSFKKGQILESLLLEKGYDIKVVKRLIKNEALASFILEFQPNQYFKNVLNEFVKQRILDMNFFFIKLRMTLHEKFGYHFFNGLNKEEAVFLFNEDNLKEPNVTILADCVLDRDLRGVITISYLKSCLQRSTSSYLDLYQDVEKIVKSVSKPNGLFDPAVIRMLLDKTPIENRLGVTKMLIRYTKQYQIAEFIQKWFLTDQNVIPSKRVLQDAKNSFESLNHQFLDEVPFLNLEIEDFYYFLAYATHAGYNLIKDMETFQSFTNSAFVLFLQTFKKLQGASKMIAESFKENFKKSIKVARLQMQVNKSLTFNDNEKNTREEDFADEKLDLIIAGLMSDGSYFTQKDKLGKILRITKLPKRKEVIRLVQNYASDKEIAKFLEAWSQSRGSNDEPINETLLQNAVDQYVLIRDTYFKPLGFDTKNDKFRLFVSDSIHARVPTDEFKKVFNTLSSLSPTEFQDFLNLYDKFIRKRHLDSFTQNVAIVLNSLNSIKGKKPQSFADRQQEDYSIGANDLSGTIKDRPMGGAGGPDTSRSESMPAKEEAKDNPVGDADAPGASKNKPKSAKQDPTEEIKERVEAASADNVNMDGTARGIKTVATLAGIGGLAVAIKTAASRSSNFLTQLHISSTDFSDAVQTLGNVVSEMSSISKIPIYDVAGPKAAFESLPWWQSAFNAVTSSPIFQSIREGPVGQVISTALQIVAENPATSAAVASVVILSVAYANRRRQRSRALASKAPNADESKSAVSWFVKGAPMESHFFDQAWRLIGAGEEITLATIIKTVEALFLPQNCVVPKSLLLGSDTLAIRRYVGEWAIATLHEHGFVGWQIENVQAKEVGKLDGWEITLRSSYALQSYQLANLFSKYDSRYKREQYADAFLPAGFPSNISRQNVVRALKSLTESFGQSALELQLYSSTGLKCKTVRMPISPQEFAWEPSKDKRLHVNLVNVMLSVPSECFAKYYPLVDTLSVNGSLTVFSSSTVASDEEILMSTNYLLSKYPYCNARAAEVSTFDGGIKAIVLVPFVKLDKDESINNNDALKLGISTCSKQVLVYETLFSSICKTLQIRPMPTKLSSYYSQSVNILLESLKVLSENVVYESVSLEGVSSL